VRVGHIDRGIRQHFHLSMRLLPSTRERMQGAGFSDQPCKPTLPILSDEGE
jgi:hypothetical protein